MSEVQFRDSQDKLTLDGWLFRAQSPDHYIILSHGYGGNRMVFGDDTLNFIRQAIEKDYNVLTFDFRASGTSEGEYSTIGYNEKYDLLGAIDFAKNNGAKHIALLGFSMGGATSILAAAENPGIIDAVISDSSFHNLRSYLFTNLSTWSNLPTFPFSFFIVPLSSLLSRADVSEVNPAKVLPKIPADKVMLIHSKSDTRVNYLESEKLLRATDSSALYWLIIEDNGPDHSQIIKKYPTEYTRRVFDFIDQKILDTKGQRHLGIITDEEQERMDNSTSEESAATSLPPDTQGPESSADITQNPPQDRVNPNQSSEGTREPAPSTTSNPPTTPPTPNPSPTPTTTQPQPPSDTREPQENQQPANVLDLVPEKIIGSKLEEDFDN
jgi:pimeloyl-ACP methyl ester carboxylesterase